MDETIKHLESVKRVTPNGGEYWMGREIHSILGYATWDSFKKVILRAIEACGASGIEVDDHFLQTTKVMSAGKGAQLTGEDFFLDRYGCYLIAMNGESSKPEIASAQTYFAIQTRRQEIADQLSLNDEQRLELRNRVKMAVKHVNSAAKDCGVVNFAFFQDAGYKGLYGMGLADIKAKKGINIKEDLFDRAGRAELAANEFRFTQTEERLKREGIKDAQSAELVHNTVGREVREAIHRIGGTPPEKLPAEPSIKQIEAQKKKALKNSNG